jgi:Uma2 family endonuclease
MSIQPKRRTLGPAPPLPLLETGDRMTQEEFHRRYERYPKDRKFELVGGIVYDRSPPVPASWPELLHNGDHMTQEEFHRRYEQYPDDVKFELIRGVVYMASPAGVHHSDYCVKLAVVLGIYEAFTPGVRALQNATTILSPDDEPQPDLGLCVQAECGGNSRIAARGHKSYIHGPPELVAEVAHSSRALDMHVKRDDYEERGVREYLVVCVEERELHWFNFASPRRPVKADKEGVYRSKAFPGLWVDGPALLALNSLRLIEVVNQGLAGKPHAAFVKKLEVARRRRQ